MPMEMTRTSFVYQRQPAQKPTKTMEKIMGTCDGCGKVAPTPVAYGIRAYCSEACRDRAIEDGLWTEVGRRFRERQGGGT